MSETSKRSSWSNLLSSALKLLKRPSSEWDVRYWQLTRPEHFTETFGDAQSALNFAALRRIDGYLAVVTEVEPEDQDEEDQSLISKIVSAIWNLI